MGLGEEFTGQEYDTVEETAERSSPDIGSDQGYERWDEMEQVQAAHRDWEAIEWEELFDAEQMYADACKLLDEHDAPLSNETIDWYCRYEELDGYDGLFVSAMLDGADEGEMQLPDMDGVHYLGYRNTKDIVVDGGTGSSPAAEMSGGRMHIKGDVGRRAGYEMQGGTVIVEGDAGRNAGKEMHGGDMEIHGSVGEQPGFLMKRGSITIHEGSPEGIGTLIERGAEVYVEDVGSLDENMRNGRVYEKGDEGYEQYYPPTSVRDQLDKMWSAAKENGVRAGLWWVSPG